MKNVISLFLFGLIFALTCSATPPTKSVIDYEQISEIGAPPQHTFSYTSFFSCDKTDKTNTDLQAHSNSAEVRQVNGLYVFLYSTPTGETEFMGTMDSPLIVASKDMDKMVQLMAKRAKEKYPQAEAIIFSNDELWSCDVVRFKQ